ncbi:MAG: glycosyltransferase [Chitinivibrionales bacterium]|nr:glycosyltransferase [Chitinivibrionales bacterium]
MPEKRILLINWRDIKNPEAGGAEVYYHEIFRRIAAAGKYEVDVLAHGFADASPEEVVDGTRIVRKGGKLLFNFETVFWVMRHQHRYDLIIEDINKVPFFTPLLVKKPRLHMIMHFFGSAIFNEIHPVMASYIFAMESLVNIVYAKERFLAISESTRKDIQDKCPHNSAVHVVEPGIDVDFFRPTMQKDINPLLVYFGRLKKYKNVQFIIKCLKRLQEEFPAVKLVVAGTGDYAGKLQTLTTTLQLQDVVSFPGFVSEEEKRNLLSRAWLMVNPSVKEGWGITNIEANLCGTLSVSSNVHGLRDSVRDGETGVLFKLNNESDYVNRVARLLRDAVLRRKMEAKAMAFGKQFAWDGIAHRMEMILDGLFKD